MAKGILLGLILAVCWIAAHILVVRVFRPKAVFMASTTMFGVTIPFYVLLYLVTPANLFLLPASLSHTPTLLGLLNGLLIYLLLYCAWWQIYFPVDRSLTLRIMVEYLNAPTGVLTYEQLRSVYSFEDMVSRRLDDMLLHGYIEDAGGGRFRLTGKGKTMTGWFLFFRKIFNIPFYLLDQNRKSA